MKKITRLPGKKRRRRRRRRGKKRVKWAVCACVCVCVCVCWSEKVIGGEREGEEKPKGKLRD